MLLMLLTLLMLLVADTAGLKHLAVLDAVDHFESPCSFEDMDRMSAIKMIAVAERFQRFNLCPGNDVKVGGSLGAPESGSLRAPESGSLGTPKCDTHRGIRDT